MRLGNKSWLLAGLVFIAGCKDNPLPEVGQYRQARPSEGRQVTPAMVLDVPSRLVFSEGKETKHPIHASVPAPGKPVVEVRGLPAGAEFDSAKLEIRWAPGYGAAGNANDPGELEREYPIRLMLLSSLDDRTFVERNVVLAVRDVLRPLSAAIDGTDLTIEEGETIEQTLEVTSEDFPAGPFTVIPKDLPAGATVEAGNDAKTFRISYAPGYGAVRSYDRSKRLEPKFEIYGPRHQKVTAATRWRIKDKQQEPIVSVVDSVAGSDSVLITVSAADPNEEGSPTIAAAPAPTIGDFSLELLSNSTPAGALPREDAVIRWGSIPADRYGKPLPIPLRICALGGICVDRKIEVTFAGNVHPAPVIDRDAWPLSRTQRFRQSSDFSILVPVTDADGGTDGLRVEIQEQENVQSAVWEYGRLRVRAAGPGPGHIVLTARSRYGAMRSETFAFNALPDAWSPVLILGNVPQRDPEVAFAMKLFPGADVVHPTFARLAQEVFELRTTLVIGTGVLLESDLASLVPVLAKVPNLIIATPRLDLVPAALMSGVKLEGRYDAGELPALDRLELKPVDTRWSASVKPVRVRGTTTAESSRPAFIKPMDTSCLPAFELTAGVAVRAPVAVACTRSSSGGKVLITGFEWADLAMDAADDGLVGRWIRAWIPR